MDSIGEITVFAEVVEAGSFVNAAARLGLTASGVSRKISRFEDRLGVRLFNRTTRTLSLTEAGEALFEQSRYILDAISVAENAARNFSTMPKGSLRVAAPDALALEVLVPFIKIFQTRYPDITTILVQGDGGVDMLNQRIDVALLYERPSATSFITRKMIDDPWIVCATPEYLDNCGTLEKPEDLLSHRCLTLHARGITSDQWEFTTDGKPQMINVKSTFSGIGLTVKEAVLRGMGVGRLAHFLVCNDIMSGRLTPLFKDHMPSKNRAIYAVYPNREHLPSKIRLFIDELYAFIHQTLKLPS